MEANKRLPFHKRAEGFFREAKEWAAVALCLGSSVSACWVASHDDEVFMPLALSCVVWALAGAWLGNFLQPYSRALFHVEGLTDRIARLSPLSKFMMRGSGALLAADVLFKTSQAFV
jgi:hypothetical protein